MKQLEKQKNVRFLPYGSPVGPLYLLGNDSSVKAVVFQRTNAIKNNIEKTFKRGASDELKNAALFLDAYFSADAGNSVHSAVNVKTAPNDATMHITYGSRSFHLDMSEFTRKEIRVYRELLKVSSGKTISYMKLSERAGIPKGARFIGNVMAKNIFPIIIPCHRVIKSGGDIGNYSGGIEIKNFLLEHESVLV